LSPEEEAHKPTPKFAVPIDEIPDYTSETTRYCIEKFKEY